VDACSKIQENLRIYVLQVCWIVLKLGQRHEQLRCTLHLIQRLSGLQLHLLGYDSIPQALTNFYMNLPNIISKFHIRSLEICYYILNRLPHHSIHGDINKLLHKKLIESMHNKDIHLQMFPFSRVTKD